MFYDGIYVTGMDINPVETPYLKAGSLMYSSCPKRASDFIRNSYRERCIKECTYGILVLEMLR